MFQTFPFFSLSVTKLPLTVAPLINLKCCFYGAEDSKQHHEGSPDAICPTYLSMGIMRRVQATAANSRLSYLTKDEKNYLKCLRTHLQQDVS